MRLNNWRYIMSLREAIIYEMMNFTLSNSEKIEIMDIADTELDLNKDEGNFDTYNYVSQLSRSV